MTLASMFATVRQGLNIGGDPKLRQDARETAERAKKLRNAVHQAGLAPAHMSDIQSLLHVLRSVRRAQEEGDAALSRTIAALRGQIAVLEERVKDLQAGGANR
jgi:hypothetical protein